MPDAQRGQTYPKCQSWSRKRLIAGPARRPGGSCLKTSEAPEVFQQGIFKGKMKKGQSWLL